MKRHLALMAAMLFMGVSAFALAPAKHKAAVKHPSKLIIVKTCPITDTKVVGNGAGSEVVGKYKVYFCCAGCQPQFDKMTTKQKMQKIALAIKKEKASSKTSKMHGMKM